MKTFLGCLLVFAALTAGCGSARSASPPPAKSPESRSPAQPPPPSPTLALAVPATPVPVAPAAAATPVPPVAAGTAPGEASGAPALDAAPPAAAVPDQPAAPPAVSRPYRDIVKLKQAGFSDEFLLNRVRADNVNYQLTTSEILDLRSAGVSEAAVEAMMRSGQPAAASAGTPTARRAEFNGLARVGKGFLVFGTSTKNTGRLVVDGETVSWYDAEDPKRNFSVYVKNVKEIFSTCVLRPGQNLCLEFGIVTFTGEEYRFRDPGWKNGDNKLVTEATSYFRQAFPSLFFSQRAVSEL